MNLRQELKKFKREGAFNLSAGQTSGVYFDLKEAFGNPELLNGVANSLYDLVDKRPDFVAARGLGGITLATAISLRQGINLTLIRDEQKKYGMCKTVEGYVPRQGESGILVDDVFTTGQNILKSVHEIWRTRTGVSGIYVVLRRNSLEEDIPVKHLYTLQDLL